MLHYGRVNLPPGGSLEGNEKSVKKRKEIVGRYIPKEKKRNTSRRKDPSFEQKEGENHEPLGT